MIEELEFGYTPENLKRLRKKVRHHSTAYG